MKLNNAVSWSQASVMRCNALSGVCDDDDDDDNYVVVLGRRWTDHTNSVSVSSASGGRRLMHCHVLHGSF